VNQNFLVFLLQICIIITWVFDSGRYSLIMQDQSQLPQELSTALEVILVQSNAIVAQKTQIDQLTKEREELRAEIRFLMSGKKREKFIDANQLLIEFADDKELQATLEAAKKEAEKEIETITYTRTKEPKKRKPPADSFPSHLPREEVEVAVPPAFQARIDSGELYIKHYNYTEALKTIPAQLVVLRYKKPVLAYVNEPEHELLVEEEANLGEKGRYHPSTAAHIINGKFGLHLPLYRLQDVYASCGLTLSRSSLDYNIELAHEVTQELPKVMLSRMMAASCLGFDDTHVTLIMPSTIPKLEPGKTDLRTQRLIEKMNEAEKEHKDSLAAKMWGYTSFDPMVPYDFFDFRVSRHRDGPAELLIGYQGHAMADCYSGNMSVILAPGSLMTRLACWAHARRKVFEYQNIDVTASALPLALINKIYDVERRASMLSVEERAMLRATETKMYLDRFREWLDGPVAASLLPQSKLAGAFNYIRNHWEALNVFVTDGRLPIDNNQGERLMRQVAIGRKNWLFVGSMRAGIRNADMMTLVASAHRNDLDVTMYMESVITHMLRGTAKVEDLLPDVWKEHHPEAVRTYRVEERKEKASVALEQAARRRVRSELRKSLQGQPS
jgi:transposase